jgi:hypothetical protein
VVKVPA